MQDGKDLAEVDEVEAGANLPVVLDVVDDEAKVGGDPHRLDGGEVDAVDDGGRVLVGHCIPNMVIISTSTTDQRHATGDLKVLTLHRPDPGAGPEVEDALRVVADGGEEELATVLVPSTPLAQTRLDQAEEPGNCLGATEAPDETPDGIAHTNAAIQTRRLPVHWCAAVLVGWCRVFCWGTSGCDGRMAGCLAHSTVPC